MRIRIARIDKPARLRAGFSLALLMAWVAAPAMAQVMIGPNQPARMPLTRPPAAIEP